MPLQVRLVAATAAAIPFKVESFSIFEEEEEEKNVLSEFSIEAEYEDEDRTINDFLARVRIEEQADSGKDQLLRPDVANPQDPQERSEDRDRGGWFDASPRSGEELDPQVHRQGDREANAGQLPAEECVCLQGEDHHQHDEDHLDRENLGREGRFEAKVWRTPLNTSAPPFIPLRKKEEEEFDAEVNAVVLDSYGSVSEEELRRVMTNLGWDGTSLLKEEDEDEDEEEEYSFDEEFSESDWSGNEEEEEEEEEEEGRIVYDSDWDSDAEDASIARCLREQAQEKRLLAEINNSRLDMVAITGMFFQDSLTVVWGDWTLHTASHLRAAAARPNISKELIVPQTNGFWDPLGLNQLDDPMFAEMQFRDSRVVEFQHGFVSMLTYIGYAFFIF